MRGFFCLDKKLVALGVFLYKIVFTIYDIKRYNLSVSTAGSIGLALFALSIGQNEQREYVTKPREDFTKLEFVQFKPEPNLALQRWADGQKNRVLTVKAPVNKKQKTAIHLKLRILKDEEVK